jgi:uncharacterized damage-inducible protein DinB
MAASAAAQDRKPEAASCLQAGSERRALEILRRVVERNVMSAADAMPADKYGFAPTDGEFKGVRTFGRELKHLAATNYILGAAALGADPPTDAGDEAGPDSVVSKTQILAYTRASFAELRRAIDRVGEPGAAARTSPISPLQGDRATPLALTVEALIHAYDHYGQMVEYLRMNGIIPPASRP